jgi:hypothetical protein
MGRVYATEDESGRRVLVRIKCDAAGCDASVPPGHNLGWMRFGRYRCPGASENMSDLVYCPKHSREHATHSTNAPCQTR